MGWPQQRGLTLLEMIVALAIVSLATTIIANASISRSSRFVLSKTATEFAVDLRRSRQLARNANRAVVVSFYERGYYVRALDLEKSWPKGVEIETLQNPSEITFSPSPTLDRHEFVLRVRDRTATVSVAPLTGEVLIRD
ncbi:MAG: prepilin-type N-terminal cleavage/methylation domain-containing protein [Pseudomonadota bacterium]